LFPLGCTKKLVLHYEYSGINELVKVTIVSVTATAIVQRFATSASDRCVEALCIVQFQFLVLADLLERQH